ncbi:MAG: FemAB family XrtA/PEP-CTERM system-associated protein, partial [Gemmataceae bacterium]
MIRLLSPTAQTVAPVWVHTGRELPDLLPRLRAFTAQQPQLALSADPAFLQVLQAGLGHTVFALEARVDGQTCGFLPLAFVSSLLFGKFLVSLPYLNSNGVMAAAADVQTHLIDRALELCDELGCKHLELRHEAPIEHAKLNGALTSKVHMRRALPKDPETLWKSYDAKVRNQVRKGEKADLTVAWGGQELLDSFY